MADGGEPPPALANYTKVGNRGDGTEGKKKKEKKEKENELAVVQYRGRSNTSHGAPPMSARRSKMEGLEEELAPRRKIEV